MSHNCQFLWLSKPCFIDFPLEVCTIALRGTLSCQSVKSDLTDLVVIDYENHVCLCYCSLFQVVLSSLPNPVHCMLPCGLCASGPQPNACAMEQLKPVTMQQLQAHTSI